LTRIGRQAKRVLVGPSAPVTLLIFEGGIDRVSGLAITNSEAAIAFIKETGTMIALDHMTSQLELSR